MKEIEKMKKILFCCYMLTIVLTINGCSSSPLDRGISSQFGFWAKNPSFLSKRKPSIWQGALDEGSRYQNKNCN